MKPLERINEWLDAFPRVRFGSFARPTPAFRGCGVTGFYLAAIVSVATCLARGRDLAVIAALCAVCGISFYVYAHARKWVTRRETIVLFEHVWFALACSVAALFAMHEPPLGYLDDLACGLPVFLASGRIGCFLVGCCHGFPSVCGVRYGEAHGHDGFPAELVGVRLFPVQLVEAMGLAAIGAICMGFALFSNEGSALVFFLLSYAVLRFGIEALRADPRPSFLGISQARWMALVQGGVSLALAEQVHPHEAALGVFGAFGGLGFLGMVGRGAFGLRARALRRGHLRALRDAVHTSHRSEPVAVRSPLGFAVAISNSGRIVSLSAPAGVDDLPLLCDVTCAAFPELDVASAVVTAAGVLVASLPSGLLPETPRVTHCVGYRLFARLGQQWGLEPKQGGYVTSAAEDEADPEDSLVRPSAAVVRAAVPEVATPIHRKQAYFMSVALPQRENEGSR